MRSKAMTPNNELIRKLAKEHAIMWSQYNGYKQFIEDILRKNKDLLPIIQNDVAIHYYLFTTFQLDLLGIFKEVVSETNSYSVSNFVIELTNIIINEIESEKEEEKNKNKPFLERLGNICASNESIKRFFVNILYDCEVRTFFQTSLEEGGDRSLLNILKDLIEYSKNDILEITVIDTEKKRYYTIRKENIDEVWKLLEQYK
jgi:hypothetical protein